MKTVVTGAIISSAIIYIFTFASNKMFNSRGKHLLNLALSANSENNSAKSPKLVVLSNIILDSQGSHKTTASTCCVSYFCNKAIFIILLLIKFRFS